MIPPTASTAPTPLSTSAAAVDADTVPPADVSARPAGHSALSRPPNPVVDGRQRPRSASIDTRWPLRRELSRTADDQAVLLAHIATLAGGSVGEAAAARIDALESALQASNDHGSSVVRHSADQAARLAELSATNDRLSAQVDALRIDLDTASRDAADAARRHADTEALQKARHEALAQSKDGLNDRIASLLQQQGDLMAGLKTATTHKERYAHLAETATQYAAYLDERATLLTALHEGGMPAETFRDLSAQIRDVFEQAPEASRRAVVQATQRLVRRHDAALLGRHEPAGASASPPDARPQ